MSRGPADGGTEVNASGDALKMTECMFRGQRIFSVGKVVQEASEKSATTETPQRGNKTSAQGKRSGALGILSTHILTP